MEGKIRNRAHIMKALAALLFMGLVWAYAQIGSGVPQTVKAAEPFTRGSILAADGTVLARTAGDRRVYPQGALAGQVVGVLGKDKGLAGIESFYDQELAHGQDITLTINPQIQAAAEAALARQIPLGKADYGSVLVLETETGRILAAASYPEFDPNRWEEYPDENWRNRPLLDVYEPGSPVKGLTVAAALNEGTTTPTTVYDTPMKRHVGGRWGHTIGDSVAHPPKLDSTGILRYSSNVGISHIVEKLPGTTLRDYLLNYGFGTKVNLDKVFTETGTLYPPDKWDDLVETTSGFGQGMSGTTLQLAAAYNTLATGGTYVPPKLVEGTETGQRRTVLQNPQAQQIRPMLMTALEGISHAAGIQGYHLAGKTGTAQMEENGKYVEDRFNSTYAGFFPTEQPRITIALMVHGASENYHGSQLAAPIYRDLASTVLSMWGLPPAEMKGGYSPGVPANLPAPAADTAATDAGGTNPADADAPAGESSGAE